MFLRGNNQLKRPKDLGGRRNSKIKVRKSGKENSMFGQGQEIWLVRVIQSRRGATLVTIDVGSLPGPRPSLRRYMLTWSRILVWDSALKYTELSSVATSSWMIRILIA